MISKQTKKISWLKSAGGSAALEFLDPVLTKMQEESKMLEKEKTESATEVKEVADETVAVVTETEDKVKETPEFITLTDFEEITTNLITALETQKSEIATLRKEIETITEKLATTVEKQEELSDSQLPAATSAALLKERLFSRLNDFGTPLTETTTLTKAPKEKVKTDEAPAHVLNGLVQGF